MQEVPQRKFFFLQHVLIPFISLCILSNLNAFYASQVLRYASENVFVPLTVGGGIRDFTDANGRYILIFKVVQSLYIHLLYFNFIYKEDQWFYSFTTSE